MPVCGCDSVWSSRTALSLVSLTIYALSGRMGGLENTNRQLAEQLQEHSDQLDTVSDQLDTVSDQLGTVLVGNTSTDIIQELENTNRQLAEQLQEHSDQLDTVTDQLDTVSDQLGTVLVGSTSTDIIQKLNASVTELRSKVNISVSPFSNCIQERTTCSIGAMGGTLANGYHFQCYPPQQDVNREVRLTDTILYLFWGGGGQGIFLSLRLKSVNQTQQTIQK